MLKYKILKQTERKWGTELFIEVLDDKGKFVQNITRTFNPLPQSQSRLDNRIKEMLVRLEAKLAEPEPIPEVPMTKDEVAEILIDKGYLEKGQTLDDLPIKEVTS